jgi:hypothetical protein
MKPQILIFPGEWLGNFFTPRILGIADFFRVVVLAGFIGIFALPFGIRPAFPGPGRSRNEWTLVTVGGRAAARRPRRTGEEARIAGADGYA